MRSNLGLLAAARQATPTEPNTPTMSAMLLNSPAVVLEIDLTAQFPDQAFDPLSRWAYGGQLTPRAMIEALRRASRDDNVQGLIAQVGTTPLGLAEIQELREAILLFSRSGKPTVAWAESFGELTPALPSYYLATAFDQIWLQPSGVLGLEGLTLAVPFVRSALDKLGLEPRFHQRFEYKNAADSLTRTGFTDAHREAATGVLESVADQLVDGIAATRDLTPAQFRGLMDQSPVGAHRAEEAGLVDHVGFRDEAYTTVMAELTSEGGSEPNRMLLGRYSPNAMGKATRSATGLIRRDKRDVGLLQLSGSVRQGHVKAWPPSSDIASTTVVSALNRIAQDDGLGALVVHIDSPGGSYVASDAIWHAIGRVRESGRPVVASMGNTAASGGYFISMAADKIVAAPATITGSIGVFAGKVLINGLLDKVGVDVGDVGVGRRAFMSSPRHDYDEDQEQALSQWLDEVYWDFVAKVSQSRGMSTDAVHEVARGRIWTGQQALQHGLVDQLGGTHLALNTARTLAGLPRSARVREVALSSPWRALRGAHNADDLAAGTASWTTAWGPFADVAARLGLLGTGPLALPWQARDIR